MSDNTQQSLFDDEAISREERELFGDRARPARPELDQEGDFLFGWLVEIQRDVDLRTGFGLVDIIVMEAISGALAGRTKLPNKGRLYAWAALHATAKNQLAGLDPPPATRNDGDVDHPMGERIAVRRGRNFISNVPGPSQGKELVGWDIVLPDRKATNTKEKSK